MIKYAKMLNRSQIICLKGKLFLGGPEVRGVAKMKYFLKQDNCGCIINNQLKFDI